MGVTTSSLDLPPAEDYLTQCCLAIRECSSIRLIHAPKELKEVVQRAVEKHWSPGGSKILETDTLWEYRLKGLPFWNSFSHQRSLQVHSLICYMLDEMQVAGWDVQTATDLSRCKDLSTFFLKRRTKAMTDRDDPVRGRRNRMMFSATLADKNKVYVVNAPKHVINQLYTIFSNHWSKGVLRVSRNKYGTIFTLKGEPWSDGKSASIQASSLVHRLVYTIGLLGWDVSTIARVKNFRDTIFFKQKRMKKFDDLVGCFLSISFYGKNRLRLIHCSDPNIQNDIENFINQSWEPGLEGTRKIHGTIEFRLNGKPFWSDSTDGIDSKLLICALLAMLQKKGWRIHNFISATRSLENKGTLLFKKEPSSDVSPMCISFDDEDKLRLISATDDVKCTVRTVITQRLGTNGIVREGNFRNCWEFKLHGAPWTGLSSDEGIKVRSLLAHILQKLSFKGWHVMTSFDVCSKIIKSDDRHPQPLDAQSWYLCKKESLGIMFDKWKKNADVEPSKNKRSSAVNNNSSSIKDYGVPAGKSIPDDPLGEQESELSAEIMKQVMKQDFCIPTIERSEAAPSPLLESLRTDDMTTPESSLTNLIRDMKCEVAKEKRLLPKEPLPKDLDIPITTFIETVDADDYEKDLDHLIIEEDSLEPVMCSLTNDRLVPYDCKTISPCPSNHDEFEIPEILDDIINTIYSDPPVFDKK